MLKEYLLSSLEVTMEKAGGLGFRFAIKRLSNYESRAREMADDIRVGCTNRERWVGGWTG